MLFRSWLTLRVLGPDVLGGYIDAIIDLTRAAHARLLDDPHLEVRSAPELTTLLVRYRREGLSEDDADVLVPLIRAALAAEGRAMVAATRVEGRRWLKLTLLNPLAEVDDVLDIAARIVAAGSALSGAGVRA